MIIILVLFSLDNFVLSAKTAGEYALFSPIQRDSDPKMFDPFFGFAVKGKSSKVRVIVRQISPKTSFQDLTPGAFLNVNSDSWSYFSRNLSNVQFLSSAWSSSTPIEWQVKRLLKCYNLNSLNMPS